MHHTPTPPPELVTSGSAEVRLKADRATVRFVVQTHGASAALAAGESGTLARVVVGAMRALGHSAEAIRTTGFSVGPNYVYQPERRLVDFIARTTIEVTVTRFDEMGTLLDAALGAGATEVEDPSFESGNLEAAQQQALQQAYANAVADARTLAQAAGGSLGALITLSSLSPRWGAIPYAEARGDIVRPVAAGAPSPQRDVVATASVQGKWIFVP